MAFRLPALLEVAKLAGLQSSYFEPRWRVKFDEY